MRCERLLRGTPFNEIVDRIANGMSATFKREEPSEYSGCRRVIVTLTGDPKIVDLFHNSRCGYRAHYYYSVRTGENVNRYAIDELIPMLRRSLELDPKRTCPWSWVEQSLLDLDAKMWIHQGTWIRRPRLKCRNLSVQRWLKPVDCEDRETREELQDKQTYGQLTPEHEVSIEIKGAWHNSKGRIPRKLLKPNRGQHIYDLGFT